MRWKQQPLRITARLCVIAGALSLAACCHTPVQADPVVDTGCVAFSAIRPTDHDIDVMSDELVDQLLVHNETGNKRCGWKTRDKPADQVGRAPP